MIFFFTLHFKQSAGLWVRNHPADYFSAWRQQSEVVQEDLLNNSGQAINSDFFCDPAVHI